MSSDEISVSYFIVRESDGKRASNESLGARWGSGHIYSHAQRRAALKLFLKIANYKDKDRMERIKKEVKRSEDWIRWKFNKKYPTDFEDEVFMVRIVQTDDPMDRGRAKRVVNEEEIKSSGVDEYFSLLDKEKENLLTDIKGGNEAR